jgi:DNA invertase Pin-like site-specific DNA recombinase
MKKAAIYRRVSTPEQPVETQLYNLRQLAAQRGFQVVAEYTDHGASSAKARRPGLDALMADARKHKFSVVIVASFDRIARSTKHFLAIVDELDSLGIEFVSCRENVDSSGPVGRFFIALMGALAEAEKSILVERIKSGMRRAKLEGQRLGRHPLAVDRAAIVRDRLNGMSLTQCSKKYGVSRASVIRFVQDAQRRESELSGGYVPLTVEQTSAVACIA